MTTRKPLTPGELLIALIVAIVCLGLIVTAIPADESPPIHILHLDEDLPPIQPGNHLIITPLYVCSFNPQTRFADWVQYTLTPAMSETGNVLERNWRTTLRSEGLEQSDYNNSPYDRGHLVPLACVSASPWAWTVNCMEVIAPQTPALNRGPWLKLEDHIRDLTHKHGKVTVTAGTQYEQDQPPLPEADETHTVPSHFWLILQAGDQEEVYLFPQQVPEDAPHDDYQLTTKQAANLTRKVRPTTKLKR